jgi:acetyl esterase/lipase
MKFLSFLIGIIMISCNQNTPIKTPQSSPDHKQIAIWPKAVPDPQQMKGDETTVQDTNLVGGKPYLWVTNVSNPTITIYSPKEKNTGAAVVVFPGGGYQGLAIDLEGSEICEWLVSIGVTGILLKYRVPNSGPSWNENCNCRTIPDKPVALEDAQRTLGLLRFHAKDWNIDPHKIGVIGFSAGGHMVADISNRFQKRFYPIFDSADKESCRPDFAIAVYPGHMLENTTRDYQLNPTIPVSKATPPTFLLQAGNDPVDTIQNSLVYYIALKKVGVSVEYHVYAEGGHAFGIRKTNFPITNWPRLVETWLRTIGIILD